MLLSPPTPPLPLLLPIKPTLRDMSPFRKTVLAFVYKRYCPKVEAPPSLADFLQCLIYNFLRGWRVLEEVYLKVVECFVPNLLVMFIVAR